MQKRSIWAVNTAGSIVRHNIKYKYPDYKYYGKTTKKNISTKQKTMAKTKRYLRKRKKGRRGYRKRQIPRALTTPTKMVRVKASQFIAFGDAGTTGRLSVQGNSCDDPFTSGGTGQPLGYDQWKALYKSAYIVGSKVTATFHNKANTSAMVGINKMKIPQGQTGLGSYEYYKELPGSVSRLLSPDLDHTKITMTASTKKHLNRKDIKDEEDLKMDLVNETPPTDIFFYHIWVGSTDQSSTSDVEAVIDVEYLVLLADPIVPSRSIEA